MLFGVAAYWAAKHFILQFCAHKTHRTCWSRFFLCLCLGCCYCCCFHRLLDKTGFGCREAFSEWCEHIFHTVRSVSTLLLCFGFAVSLFWFWISYWCERFCFFYGFSLLQHPGWHWYYQKNKFYMASRRKVFNELLCYYINARRVKTFLTGWIVGGSVWPYDDGWLWMRIEKNCRASESLIRLDDEVAVCVCLRGWGCASWKLVFCPAVCGVLGRGQCLKARMTIKRRWHW